MRLDTYKIKKISIVESIDLLNFIFIYMYIFFFFSWGGLRTTNYILHSNGISVGTKDTSILFFLMIP